MLWLLKEIYSCKLYVITRNEGMVSHWVPVLASPHSCVTLEKSTTYLTSVPWLPCLSLLFRHSVMSDSLWPRGLQHTRSLCPLPTPRACSNSCPLSQWCHPTISSSISPLSSCPQSFPASGSFPMNQFFASGGQSIGVSASVLPMNIQSWFPLGLTGLISLQFNPWDSQEIHGSCLTVFQ